MRISLASLGSLFRRKPAPATADTDTRSSEDRASAQHYWERQVKDDERRRGTADPRRR